MATTDVANIVVNIVAGRNELPQLLKELNRKRPARIDIGKPLPGNMVNVKTIFQKTGKTLEAAQKEVAESFKKSGTTYDYMTGSMKRGKSAKTTDAETKRRNTAEANLQKNLNRLESSINKRQAAEINNIFKKQRQQEAALIATQRSLTKYNYAVKSSMDRETKRRALVEKENKWYNKTNRILRPLNKAFFNVQMATLGVSFSFMTLQNTLMSAFTGLTDLSGNIKAAALGKAFTGIDTMGLLGINYKTFVEGWKSMTGILSVVQTLVQGIIAKALTPEITKSIIEVLTALATELGKKEVVKAIQDLIKAFLELIAAIIPVIPKLAEFISFLGETGLLKYLLAIILAAGILLPWLSLIGGAFTLLSSILTGISSIAAILAPLLGVTGAGLGAVLAAIAVIVVIVIGTIVNAFNEFQKTGDIVKSVIFGFIDTFGFFVDTIGMILNTLIGWTGKFNYTYGSATTGLKNMAGGYSTSTVTNNYNINGDIMDVSQVETALNKAKSKQGVSY